MLKTWRAEPGERFAIHASHYRDDELSKKWYKDALDLDKEIPKNAVLGVVEVIKCVDRGEVRKSKFDTSNRPARPKREYAIVVRTIEKFRKPKPWSRPPFTRQSSCQIEID
jgi:hypothetical protein